MDKSAATELSLFIENDGDLYRQQGEPIMRNLANKAAQGKYDHAKAVKLYMYLMDNGAKKYAREFGGEWNRIFSVPTRKAVAENFARDFETEYKLGAYNNMLSKVSAKKKMGGASNLAHGNYAGDPPKSASLIEAQKKERAHWRYLGDKHAQEGREPIFAETPSGIDAISILARPTYISETVAGRAYLRGYGKRAYLRE